MTKKQEKDKIITMFKKGEIKSLWPFYGHDLFLALFKVIMPFYVLYFLEIGLSFFQIAMIGSIRSIISIIFEIPTGTIADLYGRKTSVILGYLLASVTLFCIPFTKNFYVIAVLFSFDAIFETFVSGADRAWIVDSIDKNNKGLIDTYFLKSGLFRNIGLIAAPIIAGGIVATSGMKNLWFIFSGGMFLSTFFLFFGKETEKSGKDSLEDDRKKSEFFPHIKNSLNFILNNSAIILLFISVFVFYFVEETTSLAWSPYLEKIGISLPMIGYLFSAVAAIGILTPFVVEFFLKKKDKLTILLAVSTVYSILLLAIGLTNKALLIMVIFVFFNSMEEILLPLRESLTNSYICTKNRATVLSIKSIVENSASIIGGPIAGLLLKVVDLRQALISSGCLLLIVPFIFLTLKKKSGDRQITSIPS